VARPSGYGVSFSHRCLPVQLVEQGLGVDEVGGVEAFGEPVVAGTDSKENRRVKKTNGEKSGGLPSREPFRADLVVPLVSADQALRGQVVAC
jgi:hypothetical protein